MKRIHYSLIVSLLVVKLLAVTNPDVDTHKEAIRDAIPNDSKFGLAFLDNAITELATSLYEYEYNNYVVFSTSSVTNNGKKELIGIGVLGFVYVTT